MRTRTATPTWGCINDEGGMGMFLGRGDGTLAVSPGGLVPPSSPTSIVMARPTVSSLVSRCGSGWATVGPTQLTFRRSVQPWGAPEIAFGDFNGDLTLDVATTMALENRVYILPGDRGWDLPGTQGEPVGNAPKALVADDFNGDGKLDLAFVNSGSGKVSVLLSKGDGDFLPAIHTILGGTLTRLAAADVTGDGKADLVVISTSEDRVMVLPGNGDGTFAAPRKYVGGRRRLTSSPPTSTATGGWTWRVVECRPHSLGARPITSCLA